MEYNTSQSKLINGEYGRHIQKMIEYAIEIKDRDLRNQQARAIVRTMAFFSAGSKETEDYWNKLWDQLFVISKFRLDVDSPFPVPTPARIEARPKPMEYPKHTIKFRPYGVLIENIITQVTTEEDSPEKEQTIENIANQLKRQYLNWNRDSVNDTLIEEHLEVLSKGKLKLKENFKFISTREVLNEMGISTTNLNKNAKKLKKPNSNNGVISNNNNNKRKKKPAK